MDIGKIIVDDLIPILVIMALGWCLGWKWKGQKKPFIDDAGRQALNYFVLDIALPAALFASIAKASRKLFVQDGVLTLISFIGVTALFMLCYYLDKWLFKRNKAEAAICALIAGSPTIGFLGFAVLDPIFGDTTNTNLVIGIISIVVNAITIPIGVSLVESWQNEQAAKNGTLKEFNDKGKKDPPRGRMVHPPRLPQACRCGPYPRRHLGPYRHSVAFLVHPELRADSQG